MVRTQRPDELIVLARLKFGPHPPAHEHLQIILSERLVIGFGAHFRRSNQQPGQHHRDIQQQHHGALHRRPGLGINHGQDQARHG